MTQLSRVPSPAGASGSLTSHCTPSHSHPGKPTPRQARDQTPGMFAVTQGRDGQIPTWLRGPRLGAAGPCRLQSNAQSERITPLFCFYLNPCGKEQQQSNSE